MLVDTHAHLTDDRFTDDLEAVLDRARAGGVDWVVTVASDLDDSERTVELAGRHEGVYATVGIHPHVAETATPEALARVRDLARAPRVVAIGETGLDYHYDHASQTSQHTAFRAQLELAGELDLPVVVHAREADEDVGATILEVGWKRGVLHCFSSGGKLLELALAQDWYVSFAGMVTFAKWDGADLLRAVPLDRLLVETDCPYLAPAPNRGKRNEPVFVRMVADRVAEIRGEPADVVMSATSKNAREFYRVKG